jgi:hypothetical protein
MNQEELLRELKSLPPDALREVLDFIAFLRMRYKLPCRTDMARKSKLSEESFVGIWHDRQDMADSSDWVRKTREREWVKP